MYVLARQMPECKGKIATNEKKTAKSLVGSFFMCTFALAIQKWIEGIMKRCLSSVGRASD